VIERPEYAGCKTWVMLDAPVNTEGAEPVLSDDEFARFVQPLADIVKEKP
jgi:hypothetical protein